MSMGSHMDWKQLLAYITGSVDEELLLRNEYLVTENRLLRSQIKGRVRLSDGERKTLADLGYTISGQTVGNILKRHGIPPAPECRKTMTWNEFIRTHMDVLVATDFLTTEIWSWCGLVTYYVLFFIHLGSRRVYVVGVTPHPDQRWMV